MSSKNDPASIQGGHAAASSVQGYSELNLNPQLLRYVIAIVDEKSLTKAAEKFYLTQPTLSRYLHGMEKCWVPDYLPENTTNYFQPMPERYL